MQALPERPPLCGGFRQNQAGDGFEPLHFGDQPLEHFAGQQEVFYVSIMYAGIFRGNACCVT